MLEKTYLHLLFFGGILCQGIFATLSEKDTRVSSDLLLRKRRVINHLPDGQNSIPIEAAPYIVRLKERNRIICAGVILSHYTVITSSPCVLQHISVYQINSGTAARTGYNIHSVTSKAVYEGNPPYHNFEGIALITVDPPFEFNSRTACIDLHSGPLPAGTRVTVYGWGNMYPIRPGPVDRKRLCRIALPILNHSECRNTYESRFNVTQKHICTYSAEQYCARNDGGAPLVYREKLVGIHIWKGEFQNHRNPDVYINLGLPEYSHWIREHSILM